MTSIASNIQHVNPTRQSILAKIKELEGQNRINNERIDDLTKVLDLFPETVSHFQSVLGTLGGMQGHPYQGAIQGQTGNTQ